MPHPKTNPHSVLTNEMRKKATVIDSHVHLAIAQNFLPFVIEFIRENHLGSVEYFAAG